jgi:biofilm PGA synthesis lipoprotein PgaB
MSILQNLARRMILPGLLLGLFSPVVANALVVLQYHHISDSTPKATSTSPALFEAHLGYLKHHQFRVISLEHLADLVRSGKPLPDKTAVITFDDGYLSVYKEAYPRLKKYGFPFAVFINTQPHDAGNPNFMSWAQMKKMANQGVVFANHTVSHPHLIRRKDSETFADWQERVAKEVDVAEAALRRELGQSYRLLAYPFGEYNADLQALLKRKGYLAFGQQSGPLSPISDPQALPRFPFGGVYGGLEDFATKVNTVPMPLVSVQVKDEKGANLREPLLPAQVSKPALTLVLAKDQSGFASRINCFASGQGQMKVVVDGSEVTAQPAGPLPVGRSRYNCTAPSAESGRFYWFSQMFIRRKADGTWYQE